MLVPQLSGRHILSEYLLFRQQFILSAEGEEEEHTGEEWTPLALLTGGRRASLALTMCL